MELKVSWDYRRICYVPQGLLSFGVKVLLSLSDYLIAFLSIARQCDKDVLRISCPPMPRNVLVAIRPL